MRVNISSQSRLLLSSALLLLWLLGTAYAFWWFQFKDLRPFDINSSNNKGIFFEGVKLQEQLGRVLPAYTGVSPDDANKSVVIHFWDPTCPCSRFNEQHVRQLMDGYRNQGTRFLIVVREGVFNSLGVMQQKAAEIFGEVDVVGEKELALGHSVPSSPAAIILDGQMKLAYFGPYSEGAVCSVGGGRFVERILDRVIKGDNPQFINTMAFGCFCDWRKQHEQI